MTEAFVVDRGTPGERTTTQQETDSILQDIHEAIVKDNRALIYSHKVLTNM